MYPDTGDDEFEATKIRVDDGFEATKIRDEIEEIIDDVEKSYRRFRNFYIVSDPPFDHHFVKTKKYSEEQEVVLEEKIKEEWNMLKTSLPDWIFVRGYKSRIDLMQAVIIGPPRTPYYQGLFFFDVFFPSSYPARPPSLFYHSDSFDLNSYLPSLSKVLFRKEEKWVPEKSNVLHLLVTIREGLVLENTKPYLIINYPSISSYELEQYRCTLMLGCEAMIHTLRNPPMHFKDFVAGHFRNQAHAILINFKAHMDQSAQEDMTRLFFKLLKVFEANGTYCQHHRGQVKIKDTQEEKSKNNSFAFKMKNLINLLMT